MADLTLTRLSEIPDDLMRMLFVKFTEGAVAMGAQIVDVDEENVAVAATDPVAAFYGLIAALAFQPELQRREAGAPPVPFTVTLDLGGMSDEQLGLLAGDLDRLSGDLSGQPALSTLFGAMAAVLEAEQNRRGRR